jgi:hypothetical protein
VDLHRLGLKTRSRDFTKEIGSWERNGARKKQEQRMGNVAIISGASSSGHVFLVYLQPG